MTGEVLSQSQKELFEPVRLMFGSYSGRFWKKVSSRPRLTMADAPRASKRARAFNFDENPQEMLAYIQEDHSSDIDSSCGGISSGEESEINREMLNSASSRGELAR